MNKTVPAFVWVVIAIILLLVIGSADPKVGGWLLVIIVLGMVTLHAKQLTENGGGASW